MARLLRVLLVMVVLGLAIGVWVGWPYLIDRVRARLERELVAAVGSVSRVDALTLTLLPLRVHAAGVVIGAEPPLAQMAELDVRLWILASLAEGRPVLSVRIDAPAVDLSHPLKAEPAATSHPVKGVSGSLPPLHLKQLEVSDAQLRFRLGNTTAQLTVGHLSAQMKTGLLRQGLTANLLATTVELQRKSYHAKFAELHADGGVDAGGLFLNTATAQGERLSATAHATVIPHRLTVSAAFEPGILGVVLDELSFIGGTAQLDGTVNGDLINPTSEGRLTVKHGAIAQHVLGDLATHVMHHGSKLGFDDVHLLGADGEVSGAVDLDILKESPIHGELSWRDVNLDQMLTIIGQAVPFDDTFNATTSVHGNLDPLDLDVKGAGVLRAAAAGGAKDVAEFDLGGRVRAHDLDAHLEVTQREHNRVSARVLIDGPKLGGSVALNAADLAALNVLLPRPVPLLELSGQAHGTAEFSGTTQHPVLGGTLSIDDATVVGAPVSRLRGDFSIAAGTLTTKEATVTTAAGSAQLQGVVALDSATRNDWRLALEGVNTDLVLAIAAAFTDAESPLSGGTLDGRVSCRSTWSRAETQAEMTAKSLHFRREPIDHIDIRATTTLPQWTLRFAVAHAVDETLSIDGTGDGLQRLQVAIDSTPIDLAKFRGAGRRHLTGAVTMHGQITGKPLHPEGMLRVEASGLSVGTHELGNVQMRAEGKNDSWILNADAFDKTLNVSATVQTTAALPYTVAAKWNDTNIAKLIATDQRTESTTSGEITLAGSLRDVAKPSGAVRISAFSISRGQGRVDAVAPIQVDVEHGRFHIRSLMLSAQASRLSVAGTGTLDGDVDVDLRGEGDLVLLELIGQPFESARGQFAVFAHVVHAQAAGWQVRGQATLREAALDLGLPVAFTETNGNFILEGGTVQIESLGGRAGGGEFNLGGTVDLNRGLAVNWAVRELSLAFPEWLEERVSGKGQVQGTWKVLTVSGDIEVLNALYDRRIALGDLAPFFREQIAPAPQIGAPARQVRLDLHLHGPDGLFVDNNFAKAEMRADLRISGDTAKPSVSGTVEILNGEVTYGNRVFTITGGSAVFQDPERINPLLNITAESQVSTTEGEYGVRVAVSGTPDNPRVLFTSDDSGLTQNDVLSLVATGKTIGQAQREGGGVGVGDVLALVPSEAGDVSGRARSLFGVDRFEVEPAYVRDTGAIEPRVTIGKDLTDRFRALASSSFGVESRNTMQLEYRITSRVSLLGTWESKTQSEAGAFGGDVKFRYEFRKLPFSLFRGDINFSSAPSDAQ